MSESLDARSIAGSTVILLSARFPGISTTAVHGDNRLVDGGYSDNSGIAAALETINELMRVAQKCGVADRIAPTLIVIKNGRDTLAPPGSSSLLGQLFGAIVRPLLAPNGMFGVFTDPVRTAAGGLDAFTRIYRDLALDNPHLQHPNAIIEIALPWDETDRLPLGWAMSKMTVKAMDDKLNRTLDGPVVKRIVALMSGRP